MASITEDQLMSFHKLGRKRGMLPTPGDLVGPVTMGDGASRQPLAVRLGRPCEYSVEVL